MFSRYFQGSLLQRHRWTIGAILAVGLALLLVSIPALRWQFTAPRLGIGLAPSDSGGARVTSVAPEGSAAKVGIRPGDRLLSVGRISVPQAEDSRSLTVFELDIVNAYREGNQADWTVIRQGTRTDLSGSLVGVSNSFLLSRVIVLGVFWAIGLFLLWARPRRKTVRHLILTIFALTASVLLLGNRGMAVSTPLGALVHQTHDIGGFLAPALVIHFGVIFPICTLSDRVRRRVLWGTYGFYFVASFLVSELLFIRAFLSPEAPYTLLPPALEAIRYGVIGQWLHIVDYLVCGFFMYLTWRRVKTPALRNQIKWVLWAVLLTGGIDLLANGVALYADGISGGDLYPYRNYLYLLIAGGLLISVFRHDLFDVDVVIRQSAIYFCTTAVLLVLFAGMQEVAEQVLNGLILAESKTASTWAAASLTALLFEPVRSRVRSKAISVLPGPDGELPA